MAKPRLSSLLVFGVEWGSEQGASKVGGIDRAADQLLDRFGRRQFRGTWAVRDFSSPRVRRIRSLSVAQEIALDATAETPRESQHGFAFAAWLRDRVLDAEQAGLCLRSMVLAPLGRIPYQAVAKLGFRTIRPGRSRVRRFAEPVQPQSLRYGVWGLPVSAYWPQPTRLFRQFAMQQVTFRVRRIAQQNAVLHVVFDLAALAAQGAAGLRGVDRLMDTAAEMRDRHELRVARLMDVDHLVRLETAARPMHSILKRAA